MSAKSATRLYDGTTIHKDSHDGAARDYLAALSEPSVEVSIDGQVKKYYGREDIFRAMLDARNGIYIDAPVLALGDSRSPELFMARMVPYDIQFTGGDRQLWCSLSWDGEMCVSSILSRWILCLRPVLLIRTRVTTALLGTPMWSVAPRI